MALLLPAHLLLALLAVPQEIPVEPEIEPGEAVVPKVDPAGEAVLPVPRAPTTLPPSQAEVDSKASPEEEPPLELSKKHKKLLAKEYAKPQPKKTPKRDAIRPVSLHHVWTREILPVAPDSLPSSEQTSRFLRCHFTNQSTTIDERLVPLLLRAAKRFQQARIEVVPAFRAMKYNLMLRKKGHQVARDSAHPKGDAIDFRLPQVPTKALMRFIKALRLGGVGYYPDSKFVHADMGRVRY
jgi:uncharacterized protein YcbK (DUF882 family)